MNNSTVIEKDNIVFLTVTTEIPQFHNTDYVIEHLIFGTILIFIAIFTTFANCLVLLSFTLVRSLLNNPCNVLIFNLVISDLLVGLIIEPFTVNFGV